MAMAIVIDWYDRLSQKLPRKVGMITPKGPPLRSHKDNHRRLWQLYLPRQCGKLQYRCRHGYKQYDPIRQNESIDLACAWETLLGEFSSCWFHPRRKAKATWNPSTFFDNKKYSKNKEKRCKSTVIKLKIKNHQQCLSLIIFSLLFSSYSLDKFAST